MKADILEAIIRDLKKVEGAPIPKSIVSYQLGATKGDTKNIVGIFEADEGLFRFLSAPTYTTYTPLED